MHGSRRAYRGDFLARPPLFTNPRREPGSSPTAELRSSATCHTSMVGSGVRVKCYEPTSASFRKGYIVAFTGTVAVAGSRDFLIRPCRALPN
jgi:hypothetical protein